jgi:hypothetical protein
LHGVIFRQGDVGIVVVDVKRFEMNVIMCREVVIEGLLVLLFVVFFNQLNALIL